MIPPWVEGYVSADSDEDCWGLICRVYQEQWGLILPPAPGEDDATRARALWQHAPSWLEVSLAEARLGDVLAIFLRDVPQHCGLVIERPYMLHALKGTGIVYQRFDKHYRMAGCFRHPALAGRRQSTR